MEDTKTVQQMQSESLKEVEQITEDINKMNIEEKPKDNDGWITVTNKTKGKRERQKKRREEKRAKERDSGRGRGRGRGREYNRERGREQNRGSGREYNRERGREQNRGGNNNRRNNRINRRPSRYSDTENQTSTSNIRVPIKDVSRDSTSHVPRDSSKDKDSKKTVIQNRYSVFINE